MEATHKNTFKIVGAGFCLAIVTALGSMALPGTAQAQFVPVGESGPYGTANLAQNTTTATNTTLLTGMRQTKEFWLDALVWQITQEMLRTMINDITAWVQSGFKGGPGFVTHPGNFLAGVGDRVAGAFIEEIAPFLCEPFRLDIQFSLNLNLYHEYEDRIGCTLSDVINNISDFTAFVDEGKFSRGGWDGWFSMTQNQQNNPHGAMLSARSEMGIRIQGAQTLSLIELDWAQGFFSFKDGEGNITTPGGMINEQLNHALGSEVRSLELADEMDQLLFALLGQLMGSIFDSSGFLGGAGGTQMSDRRDLPELPGFGSDYNVYSLSVTNLQFTYPERDLLTSPPANASNLGNPININPQMEEAGALGDYTEPVEYSANIVSGDPGSVQLWMENENGAWVDITTLRAQLTLQDMADIYVVGLEGSYSVELQVFDISGNYHEDEGLDLIADQTFSFDIEEDAPEDFVDGPTGPTEMTTITNASFSGDVDNARVEIRERNVNRNYIDQLAFETTAGPNNSSGTFMSYARDSRRSSNELTFDPGDNNSINADQVVRQNCSSFDMFGDCTSWENDETWNNVTISDADFVIYSDTVVRTARIEDARYFAPIDLGNANLRDAEISSASITGPEEDLSLASLTAGNIQEGVVTEATFHNATVSGGNFNMNDLTGGSTVGFTELSRGGNDPAILVRDGTFSADGNTITIERTNTERYVITNSVTDFSINNGISGSDRAWRYLDTATVSWDGRGRIVPTTRSDWHPLSGGTIVHVDGEAEGDEE